MVRKPDSTGKYLHGDSDSFLENESKREREREKMKKKIWLEGSIKEDGESSTVPRETMEENPAEPEYPDDIEDWDDEDLEE
jgi:hypothetical protein